MAIEDNEVLFKGPERKGRNGSTERLRLERGEWQGKATHALRLLWQNAEGEWRWSQAKEDAKGRRWAVLSLRRDELRALGTALVQAADEAEGGQHASAPIPSGEQRRAPSAREQRELDKFDAEQPSRFNDGIPF